MSARRGSHIRVLHCPPRSGGGHPMRRFVPMMMLALLAVPGPALAQQSCPPDVGAALAAACPCNPDDGHGAWKNHGQYVKCVVQFRNQLRHDGCLDKDSQRTIARCAARSTCG